MWQNSKLSPLPRGAPQDDENQKGTPKTTAASAPASAATNQKHSQRRNQTKPAPKPVDASAEILPDKKTPEVAKLLLLQNLRQSQLQAKATPSTAEKPAPKEKPKPKPDLSKINELAQKSQQDKSAKRRQWRFAESCHSKQKRLRKQAQKIKRESKTKCCHKFV